MRKKTHLYLMFLITLIGFIFALFSLIIVLVFQINTNQLFVNTNLLTPFEKFQVTLLERQYIYLDTISNFTISIASETLILSIIYLFYYFNRDRIMAFIQQA